MKNRRNPMVVALLRLKTQTADFRGDGDPFAGLKDESLKLKPGLDDYPDLPAFLDRRRANASERS